MNIVSVFQLVKEVPQGYFGSDGMKFDTVYADLLKRLFLELSLGEYRRVRILIDARKHAGGKLGERVFKKSVEDFLVDAFPKTRCTFKLVPSYADILIELADFVSNTLYKEYRYETEHVFATLGCRLIQIKNPL